ncbi:hypothetical protein [Nitrosomonas sp. Nm34]|uniref:hypothetical protein n=1 Tax=Nitrosomonas sp. Nm34 TaxID=1881055 RepID=UPI0008F08876|nr:hypothetical protein [Nitrosomonas sp. Nm34]SFI89737.1 hypothetical protein SAMN05428978_105412 [Nitrosomonas sp. Nm34]
MDTTTVFCASDEFCKEFEPRWEQHLTAPAVSSIYFHSQHYLLLRVMSFISTKATKKGTTMPYRNFLLDAVTEGLTWNIPNEVLVDAVKAQAGLMADFSSEEFMESAHD